MRRIRLVLKDDSDVATVEITAFPAGHCPDVVVWGDRIFTRRNDDCYEEAFAVWSLSPPLGP